MWVLEFDKKHLEKDEGLRSKYSVGSWARHETHEEGQKMHRLKRREYNNKVEDNSSNTRIDKEL